MAQRLSPEVIVDILPEITRKFGEEVAQELALRVLKRISHGLPVVAETADGLRRYLLRAASRVALHVAWDGKSRLLAGQLPLGRILVAGIEREGIPPQLWREAEQLRRLEALETLADCPLQLLDHGVTGGPASGTARRQRYEMKKARRNG